MDIVPTSAGYALVGDDGVVVSVHRDPNEALQRMNQMEYAKGGANPNTAQAFQGGPQAVKPSLSGPVPKVAAPTNTSIPDPQPGKRPPPKRLSQPEPDLDPNQPATQAALDRSRVPLDVQPGLDRSAAIELGETPGAPPNEVTIPERTIVDADRPPLWKVGKRGRDYVLFEDGQEVARFPDEDTALEHMNLRKYAWQQGLAAPAETTTRRTGQPMAPPTRWAIGQAAPPGEQGPRFMSRKYGGEEWDKPETRALANPWAGEGEAAEAQFKAPEPVVEPPRRRKYAVGQGITEE